MHRFCARIELTSGRLSISYSRTKMREHVPPVDRKNDLAKDERWQVVERIAASPGFQKSAHLRELLLYITERTLHGHASQLTEHDIGHTVFGKPADYSPLEDSSVRVHARQLRLHLHEYFDSVGRSEPLVVEIPKGSYVPVFRSASADTTAPSTPRKGIRPLPSAAGRVIPWILCAILATACAFLGRKVFVSRNTIVPLASAYPPWPLTEVFDS